MVSDNGEIKITWNGYEVISTQIGDDKNLWSALDTIKNSRGEIKTMTRLEWKQYFNK